MKTTIVGILSSLLLCSSLFAADPALKSAPMQFQRNALQELPSNGETVADMMRSIRLQRQQQGKIGPNVISVDSEASSFLIPAAGSVGGANGTYFRSDVTLANRRSTAQIIQVGWIARGVNNASAPTQRFSINPNTTTFENDFVNRILGKSGLGSILVLAVDSAGNADSGALIDGFSRIWTPQPGSSGTVSQEFSSVDVKDSLADSYGYGLRQDASYRTNVGLVNLYDTPQTFTINVVGFTTNTSFTQTVQPYSMEQVPLPAGNYGDLYIRVASGPNLNWWSAYGTSVDNITGDGWVSHVH